MRGAPQTGIVDAFGGFATAMENTKIYKVTEQFVLSSHLVGVSVKFWGSLSVRGSISLGAALRSLSRLR